MGSQTAKTVIFIIFGAAVFINAAYMLISPRKWIDSPFNSPWTTSLFSNKKDTSRMFEVEVRLFGGLLIAAVAWVIYDSVLSKLLK